MSAELTAAVKQIARDAGADLVGIGGMDRFEGAPLQFDPRYIFPEAKSIVGFGFRIPRGYLRGVEEGTHFYQYPSMGYANINEVHAPLVLREVACFIEDQGYEGAVVRNFGGTGTSSDFDGREDESPDFGRRIRYSRPVREGLPAPDVFVHFRIAGFICGMGEIGYSNLFLSPEYGPRQRLAFMLTDAPLEPDPLCEVGSICDQCKQCVSECPGALSRDETVMVTIAGREVEISKLDPWYCAFAYASGRSDMNPFLPPDALDEIPDGAKILRGEKRPSREETMKIWEILGRYYRKPNGYNPAICGGRGCIRACMVHLENKGVLKKTFRTPFRKREPWWHESFQE